MNSKMMSRLLLVFCAVGLSRLEHFLVETETEASGEDYASKGSGSREIQHKKSDGGDRKLDTGEPEILRFPSALAFGGSDQFAEYLDIIKSQLPKFISEVKDNPGRNVTIDTDSLLLNIPNFLMSGNIGLLFDIAELAWPGMKDHPFRDVFERTWGQILPLLMVKHDIRNHQTSKVKLCFLGAACCCKKTDTDIV